MDYDSFKQQIEFPYKWAKDFNDKITIGAAVQRTLRLVLRYPELAKKYMDTLPKATMDNK